MPHVDGLQATAQIMTTNPRPIVIVSSESREGAASTLKALELGAIEFVAKPSSGIDLDMQSVKEELLRKVRMSAKVRVVRTASRLATTVQGSATVRHAPAAPRARRCSARATESAARPALSRSSFSAPPPADPPRSCVSLPASRAISRLPFSSCSTCPRHSPRNTPRSSPNSPASASRKPSPTNPFSPALSTSAPARNICASLRRAASSSTALPAASTAICPTSTSPWNPPPLTPAP